MTTRSATPVAAGDALAPTADVVRVLGIDPGSRFTGVGIIDVDAHGSLRHVFHTTLVVGAEPDFPHRLKRIYDELRHIVDTCRPDECSIEKVFMARNADSALKLGQARGAAICAVASCGTAVNEYAATEVKQAVVGTGRAAKVQVQHMVALLLGLSEPLQADAADALAIAVTHAHMRGGMRRLGISRAQWRRRR